MDFENSLALGNGIYTIPEITSILRIPYHKARNWVVNYWDKELGEFLKGNYSWKEGNSKAVGFHTLVEIYIFIQLAEAGVSNRKILQAHKELSSKFNTPFPFAKKEIIEKIQHDGNMPHQLAEGFNILQKPENLKLKEEINVKSIIKESERGIEDEAWIPKAGKMGACIITQDFNIHRIRHQRELCNKYNLGMFYFRPPSKNGFSYWGMLRLLVKHWPEITKIATREKRPFAYK